MKIVSYIIISYPEGEMEQQSVSFSIDELERAKSYLNNSRERDPETTYKLIGVFDI